MTRKCSIPLKDSAIPMPSMFSLRQRAMERLEELRAILDQSGAKDLDSYLAAKVAEFRRRGPSSSSTDFPMRGDHP
ncbi:hypothetical protein [Acidithiobacillus sp.]|uniref:hypothetical protein n=1 Tax=Acidithiobacillus sp. TaxID=1872118 RepID=UPI003CFF7B33